MSRFSERGIFPAPYEAAFDSQSGGTPLEGNKPYIEPLLAITPYFFLERNHTSEVKDNLAEWQENKNAGRLIAAILCGDARVWIPESVGRKTASIRALGAGGNEALKRQYASIMNSSGVESVAYLGHFDGTLFVPKKSPRGCGITDEHGRQMDSGEEINGNGYQQYASKHVHHEDPVIQTIYSSLDALELTDKWVGAVALDHTTGISLPVGYFRHRKNGYTSQTGINPIHFDKRRYNAGKIYAEGLPVINEAQLERMPESLRDYLSEWDKEMEKVRGEYAARGVEYTTALKIQNPSVVSLSTDPRPVGIRYRLGPNTVFKLRVPRQSIEDEEFIAPERLQDVLDQANYPITQNTKHYDQPGSAFSNTHTLLIETKRMEKSLQVAEVALAQDFIRDWLELPDERHPHQILVGEVNKGVTTKMEVFAQGK